jgi:outer membrane protein assembly factor BamB
MRHLACIVAMALVAGHAAAGDTWPEFRGPTRNGHADAPGLPLTWSETEHVAWKAAIHDRGWSSPVIWKDQVWLTTATRSGKELFAVCVDRESGRIVHDVKVFDVPRPQRIASINSYASPTSAIEAGRVYVHYGTYGTACLDTATGKTLWTRRDLECDHHMGPGSSLMLFENLLIFHVDGCDVQYVVALDTATGKTVWKTDRSVDYSRIHRYTRKAFCTPVVVEAAGRLELISPCSKAVFGYDPRTGKELWKVRHGGWSMTARPLTGHGLVYVITDFDYPELWALRPGGEGDVTDSHVAWTIPKGHHMPKTPSLLLIGDHLYMVRDGGTATCVEAKTGRIVWQERIGGEYASSPLYAAGRIYCFSQAAKTTVLEPGAACKVLAVNDLDGKMLATPAVAGNALYLRTETHLYRIEE